MRPPAPPSPDIHLNESALVPFTGDDRSDELEATSKLSLVNGALQLKNGDNPPASLNPIASNEFQAEDLATIKFHEVGKGHVSGLTLFSQAVRGITYPQFRRNICQRSFESTTKCRSSRSGLLKRSSP